MILLILVSVSVYGQELEPRSLTNVPVGTNFGVVGYGWTQGNVLLDPAVSIEDLNAQMHAFAAAYVRAISLFGMSGKIDAILPFATGDWSGTYQAQYTTTGRTGFGDPRLRLSVNFLGARPLTMDEFGSYQQKTILGMSVQIYLPIGQYFPDRLINLGSNRFSIRPQIGVSQKLDKWLLEAYASVWFFTINRDFWGGNEMTQNPLYALKIHVIRSLPSGMWLAIDAGYGAGGVAFVNGVERESNISTFRFGGTLAFPVGKQHTLRVSGFSTYRMAKGPDYDLLSLTYQFRWGGKQ